MRAIYLRQRGASAIGIIIVLAIIGIGVFLGMQYIPHYMESAKIDNVLTSLEEAADKNPVKSAKEVGVMIDKRLQVNNLEDRRDLFEVKEKGNKVFVNVVNDWSLNLLYEHKNMHYERELVLAK